MSDGVHIVEALKPVMEMLADLKAQQEANSRRWLTIDEVGAYCSLSSKTISRLIAEGRLHASHPTGGACRIDRQEVDRYMISSQKRKGTRGRRE